MFYGAIFKKDESEKAENKNSLKMTYENQKYSDMVNFTYVFTENLVNV